MGIAMNRSVITFATPLFHSAAIVLSFTYCLFFLSRLRLKNCFHQIRSRGVRSALPFCFWHLRWYFAAELLSIVAAGCLVVGSHRTFAQMEADAAGLTLNYPWPRQDVHLGWKDVTGSIIEKRQFRFRYMFRLKIQAGSQEFYCPWTGGEEVEQGSEIIESNRKAFNRQQ